MKKNELIYVELDDALDRSRACLQMMQDASRDAA